MPLAQDAIIPGGWLEDKGPKDGQGFKPESVVLHLPGYSCPGRVCVPSLADPERLPGFASRLARRSSSLTRRPVVLQTKTADTQQATGITIVAADATRR